MMGSRRTKLLACLFCSWIALAVGQVSPAAGPASATAPAPAPANQSFTTETRPLDPFSRVAVCVPFTVLVQPTTGYQLTIDAEAGIHDAITTLIDGNTLILEASALSTKQQIKVTVGLPASNLSAITARGTAPVIVSPGFSSAKLSVNAQGTGSLGVLGVNYTNLDLVNSGTGTTVVSGLVQNATVRASGTGAVYVAGLTGNAAVTLSGTGSIYINSSTASAAISGSSTGTGKVFYSAGSCQVQSSTPEWIFGPKCQQGPITIPDTSATWTCGLEVTGRYACSGGSGTAQNTDSAGCTQETVTFPTAGSVSSYSLVDRPVGDALGLGSNANQGSPGGGRGSTGQGSGIGGSGSGNGNFNGDGNGGGNSRNGNGGSSMGQGNGQNSGNNNLAPSGR